MSNDPLPSSDEYVEGKRPCVLSIPDASLKLMDCMASANTKYQFDGNADLLEYRKCACYFNFKEVGKECSNSGPNHTMEYAYQLGNHTGKCQQHFEAWSHHGPADVKSWWQSSQGIIAQVLIVVLLLAMLLWCCQDWFFNVLERYQEEVDEEMREEETRAPPRSPIEKVQRMGRIGGRIMQNLIRPKAAPLRKPSSDEEDETELAEEPEEPKPRRSLHNFQAPRDLGSDPFVPLMGPMSPHRSVFPPGTAPP
ncbi:unnamed protein product [Durusdinium trenchii]|uniref:Uncharacterized protein n=1 Tax=Durusdinium trenchii TaxID=1381693 RepID=A0ABP0SXL9_9DINO